MVLSVRASISLMMQEKDRHVQIIRKLNRVFAPARDDPRKESSVFRCPVHKRRDAQRAPAVPKQPNWCIQLVFVKTNNAVYSVLVISACSCIGGNSSGVSNTTTFILNVEKPG